MAKLTTKYSAGFKEDFFLYATNSRIPFPSTESTPARQSYTIFDLHSPAAQLFSLEND